MIQDFQKLIETDLSELMTQLYPKYMNTYVRFRKMNGPGCPYCKGSAKLMYMEELKRKGPDFTSRFKTNNWEDYE
jgi:hypothetical protein